MTTQTTNNNTLNITQTDVMMIITRIIKVDGLEAARAAFKQMNDFFSGMKGWAETTDAVYDLFAEKRKEEKQQQREEKPRCYHLPDQPARHRGWHQADCSKRLSQ